MSSVSANAQTDVFSLCDGKDHFRRPPPSHKVETCTARVHTSSGKAFVVFDRACAEDHCSYMYMPKKQTIGI